MPANERSIRPSRRQVVAGAGAGAALAATQVRYPSAARAGGETASAPASGAFERAYVENAVEPFRRRAVYEGPLLELPMIDLAFGKKEALTPHLWGLAYEGWRPNMEEEGLSVFIQGYGDRGPHNERKRIYVSAITPDLYAPMYRPKVAAFLDGLFAPANAGEPLMRRYYEGYFDLYWDLHLGVRGEDVPQAARDIGESFNAVLGFYDPQLPVVHEHYMRVRALRERLKAWIAARLEDVEEGRIARPEATFVHYWLRNGGEHFRRKDVVFECLHNFVAFSQWGTMLYGIAERLEPTRGDPQARRWFERTMAGRPDAADGSPFTPLERLAMEFVRVVSPSAGSLSTLAPLSGTDAPTPAYLFTPHPENSRDPRHWERPDAFDPDRYRGVPTSADADEERCRGAGLASCPFERTSMKVADGRDAAVENGGFGAVHPVVDGRASPVADTAGYAPFGFGYRRCAGEWLTIAVLADLLRRIARDGVVFERLAIDEPERLPVGPVTVIEDDIGFRRTGAR